MKKKPKLSENNFVQMSVAKKFFGKVTSNRGERNHL